MIRVLLLLVAGGLVVACSVSSNEKKAEEEPITEAIEVVQNPPADGFNVEGSDMVAVMLADQVMEAMGGRKNWNNTRYLSWNFFGARRHLWDKWTGNVRIESLRRDLDISMNLKTMEGRVIKAGLELTHADSLTKYLEFGKSAWINDSYWLVMPFKLKDSGVTLKHLGTDTTMTGSNAEVLGLTFEDVGDTPQNMYKVWVDSESNLVSQWAFFREASDSIPRFTLPWADYEQKGNILLSGDRGERDVTEIQVLKNVPENIFDDFSIALITLSEK